MNSDDECAFDLACDPLYDLGSRPRHLDAIFKQSTKDGLGAWMIPDYGVGRGIQPGWITGKPRFR